MISEQHLSMLRLSQEFRELQQRAATLAQQIVDCPITFRFPDR